MVSKRAAKPAGKSAPAAKKAAQAKVRSAVKAVSKAKPVAAPAAAVSAAPAPEVKVRKIATFIDEVFHEGGPVSKKAYKRGAIAAIVANPYAGRYVEDITPMMDALKPIGYELAERLIKALGGPKKIESYGKAVIVGVNGESEHAALWHVPGGYGMREMLENSKAIVPSAIKVAAAGGAIDVPLHHRTAAYVRSHFDAIEMRVPDSPRPDELMLIIAMGTGPRIHERVGGMRAEEISKYDGQR